MNLRRISLESIAVPEGWRIPDEWAYIEGNGKYILLLDNCVHYIKDIGTPFCFQTITVSRDEPVITGTKTKVVSLATARRPICCFGTVEVSHANIRSALGPAIDITQWVHYWGVKLRIEQNYRLLRENCKKLCITADLTEWKWKN